jgi:hypothetical protein
MPKWSDNTDLFKVDRATDTQLRSLARLRRANGSFYRGDFDTLSKGEAGRQIRSETQALKQQRKDERDYKRRNS